MFENFSFIPHKTKDCPACTVILGNPGSQGHTSTRYASAQHSEQTYGSWVTENDVLLKHYSVRTRSGIIWRRRTRTTFM